MPRPRLAPVPSPASSEKRERFLRIAPRRTSEAVKCIRGLGKLSAKTTYEMRDADRKQIITVLRQEVDQLEGALAGGRETVIEFEE